MQRLGAAQHGRQRLVGGAHHVDVRLLGGERGAGGLGVEPHPPRGRVAGADPVPHEPGPDAPGRSELGNLLEQVVVGVPEEREARGEVVNVQPGPARSFHVGETVADGECDLLGGGRPGLADVIAADRDGVPPGHLGGAVSEQVGDQPHRRLHRVDVRAAGDVLLEDVVLYSASQLGPGTPCSSATSSYRSSRTAAVALIVMEVDTSPRGIRSNRTRMSSMVSMATPTLPTSPWARGCIRVEPHLGRQVERHRKPCLAGFEKAPGTARWSAQQTRTLRIGAWSISGPGTWSG